jgi:integrase
MAIRTFTDENGKKTYEVYVNGFDARGLRVQRKRAGIMTQQKAKTVEFELKRELAQKREEAVPYRWEEWFEMCVKRMKIEYKPSTVYNYTTQMTKWIHPHWKGKEIQTITKSQVFEVVFEKCKGIVSPNNRKTILKMLKRLFQMAIEDGILDRNPCTGISVKAPEVEQKVLTNKEVEIFLREAQVHNHRFYPHWLMALMTGMRSGELAALKWTDVDLESRTISVSKQWSSTNGLGPTKSGRTRIVPIAASLGAYLKERKMKSQDDSVLPMYKEWENGEQARITREFCEAVNITPVKFHDLRATFITNLLARGESLAKVMSMVGHSQLKTTNGYLRKAGVDVQGGCDRLGYEVPTNEIGQLIKLQK